MNAPTPSRPAVDRAGRTVLVVDDDRGVREALSARLRGAGYRVVIAAGGREALQQWDAVRPAVAVLDANMPDMSGPDLCRWIKERGESESAKVIFLTGASSPSPEYVARCAQFAGADRFLTKPYDGAQLVALIDELSQSAAGAVA
ncbi:MAG: response regulator [Planctomycetes bacterium]|nr:response regulator [Planctomycetota bacterium]